MKRLQMSFTLRVHLLIALKYSYKRLLLQICEHGYFWLMQHCKHTTHACDGVVSRKKCNFMNMADAPIKLFMVFKQIETVLN